MFSHTTPEMILRRNQTAPGPYRHAERLPFTRWRRVWVAIIRDATAGARNDQGDGYEAAMVNWRFMAHALWTTQQALAAMKGGIA